jgi:hypothetical protein
MTITVQGASKVIYVNKTGSSIDLTLGASGQVAFDVNTPGAAAVRHVIGPQGGAISFSVGSNANIDANVGGQATVQVEFLHVR